jgi:hypothetical protein
MTLDTILVLERQFYCGVFSVRQSLLEEAWLTYADRAKHCQSGKDAQKTPDKR